MSTTSKASQRSHLSRIAVSKQNISKKESEPKSTKTSFTSSVSSNYKPLVTKPVRNSSLKQPSSNKVLVSKAVTSVSYSSLSSNLSRPVVSSVTTKSQQPIQSSSRSSSFSQQFRTQKRDFGHSQSKGKSILVLPVPTEKRITQDGYQQEIQRLATLCEARTKELGWLKLQLKRVTLGFDSFSVLIKYLTNELDAFSNPWLVNELHTTRKDLDLTKSQLKRYQGEVEDLKRCHTEEIAVLKEKLVQVRKKEIKRLVLRNEQELEELKTEYEAKMVNLIEYHAKAAKDKQDNHSCELLTLKKEHDQFVEELENKFTDQLKATIQSREETVAYLQQQLESLEREKETMEEALRQDSESKLQWIINQKADLKKEVDSLKLVLEMRKTEIQDLRKENLMMKKDLEELTLTKEQVQKLRARNEDLQARVNQKVEAERHLSCEQQKLKESFEKESKVSKRLSMENEELQWKLKQSMETSILLNNSIDETPEIDRLDHLSKNCCVRKSPIRMSVFFDSADGNPNQRRSSSPSPRASRPSSAHSTTRGYLGNKQAFNPSTFIPKNKNNDRPVDSDTFDRSSKKTYEKKSFNCAHDNSGKTLSNGAQGHT